MEEGRDKHETKEKPHDPVEDMEKVAKAIEQAFDYLYLQLKNPSQKKGGGKIDSENEYLNGMQGKIFEHLAPRVLTSNKVTLDNQKIICNNIFVEGMFTKLNDEYNKLLTDALSKFPDIKKNYIPTDVTDAEMIIQNTSTVSARCQIEIDSIFTTTGSTILDWRTTSKEDKYVVELGDFKLEADKEYNFIVEVSVNFLTQTKTKMSQLINYILFFRENSPHKDYVITLLTAGDFHDFTRFVNGFNQYFQDDDHKIPKDKIFRDCLEKVYILKNLMKKGKSGKEGTGTRVLFIYMPFYLDKKNLDECLQNFRNFKNEQGELRQTLQKTRDSQKSIVRSEMEAKKQLEDSKKENEELKNQIKLLMEENQRLSMERKAFEDEVKRFRLKDSMDSEASSLFNQISK